MCQQERGARVLLPELFHVSEEVVERSLCEDDSIRRDAWLGDAQFKLALSEQLHSNPRYETVAFLSQQSALLEQNTMMAVWLLEGTGLAAREDGVRTRSDHSLGTIFEALYKCSISAHRQRVKRCSYCAFVHQYINDGFMVFRIQTKYCLTDKALLQITLWQCRPIIGTGRAVLSGIDELPATLNGKSHYDPVPLIGTSRMHAAARQQHASQWCTTGREVAGSELMVFSMLLEARFLSGGTRTPFSH